jgi:fused signal recognition particle receptor
VLGFKRQKSSKKTPSSAWSRIKQGLSRTQQKLGQSLKQLCGGQTDCTPELLEALEEQLLTADVGLATTEFLLQQLQNQHVDGASSCMDTLHQCVVELLRPCQRAWAPHQQPTAVLMVGVNGAGKTTTIGKLTKHFHDKGQRVLLAAGDTFRAAAVAQLQNWGDRYQTPVIAQGQNADSAAVIFDGLQAARARGCQLFLADTAGRLHTQEQLMKELQKVKKVMQKQDPECPHEVWLVLDAGIGQNAVAQAKAFHAAVGLTGLIITKLDGTAKGGVLLAIAHEMALPIIMIGVGEGEDDLMPFDAEEFTAALLRPTTTETSA